MKLLRMTASAGLLLACALPSLAQNILYQHNYNGTAGTPLHKLAADVDNNGGGSTWHTRTDTLVPSGTGVLHYADGAITAATYPNGAAGGQAMLGFTPEAGNIYAATLSINSVTLSNTSQEWLGFGFAGSRTSGVGGQAQFFGDSNAWMIYRGNTATAADQTFIGPGATGGQNWASPVVPSRGSPVDLRVVLNTTNPQWTVEWLAKVQSDPTFTSLRTEVLVANPTIHAVGYTVSNSQFVSASIESFTLTTSGDTYAMADINSDGSTNLADLDVLRGNFGNAVFGPSQGDLNNDGTVDYTDFRTWKQYDPLNGAGASLGVPEPSTGLLGAAGLLVLGVRRRRMPG